MIIFILYILHYSKNKNKINGQTVNICQIAHLNNTGYYPTPAFEKSGISILKFSEFNKITAGYRQSLPVPAVSFIPVWARSQSQENCYRFPLPQSALCGTQ